MAELLTYPLNNVEYYAEDAEIYHSTRSSGVFANDSFSLTKATSGWNVEIGTGLAWIKNKQFAGKSVALKQPVALTVDAPPALNSRIDAVVIRFSSVENKTFLEIKKGAESAVPSAPDIQKTENEYELHLYHILVRSNDTSILNSQVTDLRQNTEYCGLMYDEVTPLEGYYIEKSEKGVPGGVASLDDSAKVPSSQLPEMDFIPNEKIGIENGVAPLGENGKLPTRYLESSVQAWDKDDGSLSATDPEYYGDLERGQIVEYTFGDICFLEANFRISPVVGEREISVSFSSRPYGTYISGNVLEISGKLFTVSFTSEHQKKKMWLSLIGGETFDTNETLYVIFSIASLRE